jgi:hypothetical protein
LPPEGGADSQSNITVAAHAPPFLPQPVLGVFSSRVRTGNTSAAAAPSHPSAQPSHHTAAPTRSKRSSEHSQQTEPLKRLRPAAQEPAPAGGQAAVGEVPSRLLHRLGK